MKFVSSDLVLNARTCPLAGKKFSLFPVSFVEDLSDFD